MTDNLGQVTGREADIVVGVDGSDESFAALRWALGEASLTGQHVNAVFGWTHSWDMGAKPETDDAWKDVREQMTARLRDWVDRAGADMDFDPEKLKLTSVRATGTHALLELGSNAQQIVVGRRSLNRVARWFLGSLSASLAEEAKVPVTVVRFASDEEADVQDAIANSLTPGDSTVHYAQPPVVGENRSKPVVVGIDGSVISRSPSMRRASMGRRCISCSAGSSRIWTLFRAMRTRSRRCRWTSSARNSCLTMSSRKRISLTRWTSMRMRSISPRRRDSSALHATQAIWWSGREG